jgi:hypothetical protein
MTVWQTTRHEYIGFIIVNPAEKVIILLLSAKLKIHSHLRFTKYLF